MGGKVVGFDKFLDTLAAANLADSEIQTILEENAKIALPVMRRELKNAIGKNSTGQLESALGISPVKRNHVGIFNIKIGFNEPRKDGKQNAMVANILEYGQHKGRNFQPPNPWLARSLKKIKRQVTANIKKSLEEKLKGFK